MDRFLLEALHDVDRIAPAAPPVAPPPVPRIARRVVADPVTGATVVDYDMLCGAKLSDGRIVTIEQVKSWH